MSTATKTPTKNESPTHSPASTRAHSPAKNSATAGPGDLAYVQQSAGNLAIQQLLNTGAIKAKLTISQPNDPDEQEADAVADRIMRMPDGVAKPPCPTCAAGATPCPTCSEGQPSTIHRKTNSGTGNHPSPAAHHVIGRLGPGHPLDKSTRAFFEPRFGSDLSHVRVHTGAQAEKTAKSISAKAFTIGPSIAFGIGQYAPESQEGRTLLSHELTHVTQQPRGMIARAVARNYSTIQSDLTYGVIDWQITEAECDEVLGILTSLSPTDLEDTVQRMQHEGLVTRLRENVSRDARIANATLLQRIQEIGQESGTGESASIGTSTTEPVPEAATHAPETFDPCLVDVYGLSNAGLLSYYQRALAVVNQGRGAANYFDNRNLQRRLITERNRRADMGHYWLADMPDVVPRTLYRLAEGPSGSFRVLEVPGETMAGLPEDISSSPLGTRAQYDRFLEENNIEPVDENTYMRRRHPPDVTMPTMLGTSLTLGGLYNAPGDLPLMWRPRGAPPLAPGGIAPWPSLPEVFYGPEYFTRFPRYMRTDALLNPPAMNPELAEQMKRMLRAYRRAPGVPFREVNPLIIDPNTPVTTGTAAVAVTDIPNLGLTRTFGASAEALPPTLRGTPGTTGGSVFTPVNPTAVDHAEHVALENLRRQIDRALALGDITRADLRGRTVYVMVEQEPCPSCGSGAGSGPPGVLEQFARRYPELTIEVRNMRNPMRAYVYRSGVLLNPSRNAPALPLDINTPVGSTVESVMTPEFARTLRYGGGVGGEIRAMGASGLQGAGLSGVIAVATSAGVMLFDTRDHPEWAEELALTGGLATSAGFLGSATEQVIISRGTGSVVSSIVETGASRLTPGMVTGLGRAGGGAVGAMFVEGISMGLLEEREHFAPEIATRTVRSGLLGAGSVWAGAATGAAVGSAVPVAGTAIGFIVGLFVGGVLYYAGDRLVPGGRGDWDAYEAGCHFRSGSVRSSEPTFGRYCFTGDTPIRMADGTDRRIDQLCEGDCILSYDESNASLHKGKVLKIERSIAPTHFKLHLAKNWATVGVTGEHPIHTEGLWLPAKMLHAGSMVTWLDDAIGEVNQTAIADMTTDSRPVDVYDLSVSDYHTFFAGGILAHNKNM